MKLPKTDEWVDLSFNELEKYSKKPIFIVGSPRSGTTLMRYIIDAHPNIFCPPCETFLFNTLNTTFNGFIWKDHYAQLPFTRKALIKWLRKYILDLFGNLALKTGKRRWAEKTPSHILFMDFINEVFPDAQFIHMIRNGYDVVKSLKNIHWGSNDIAFNANLWVEHVTKGREFGRKLSPERYIEIRFEDLVNETEMTIRRICEFLDEEMDPRMLKFHLPENNSWGLNLKPLKKEDIGKYKDLNIIERNVFNRIAGSLMRDLGYWQ
jgi:hypothetical protein